MKRIISLFFLIISSAAVSALFSQTFYKALEPGAEQLAVYVEACDWGPCVSKIVVNTNKTQKPESLELDDFEVERVLNVNATGLKMSSDDLDVTDVFCSDSKGNRVEGESIYITILLDVYPEADNSSPFPGNVSGNIINSFYNYRVTNDDLKLKITKCQGFVCPELAKFSKASFDYEIQTETQHSSVTMPYMYYLPQNQSKEKIPMILWFHTIGESGNNPYRMMLGTKTTALAGEGIQKYFENGVAILAPQCPTGWLETTEQGTFGARYWEPVDVDGSVSKVTTPVDKFLKRITGRQYEEPEITPFAAVSYYTAPVTALLQQFLDKHPEIDRERVYVGGASAGGYMTMNMMIQHPEYFAAAFPTCEYYLDSKISKSQIKMLAEKPLWFTYAKNDSTVKPSNNSIPTIKRLKEAGAKNLKVSEFENVVDLSGKVPKNRRAKEGDREYGLPYEYEGHASWIYVLNDQCRDQDGLSLFEWLSRQRLHVEK